MKIKNTSMLFSLIIISICLSYNLIAQMRVTAAYYKNKVDSIARIYATNAKLGSISCTNLDTTGKSAGWRYIYLLFDSLKAYYFSVQNNQITFDSTCRLGVGIGVIGTSWIDSDSAYAIADRSGGASIRKRFPTCSIMCNLGWDDLPDNLIRWWLLYKCSDSTRMISINAANGIVVSVMGNEFDQFALYQNYPNPFNPITNISFRLLRQSNVTLKIFDIIGREITTIINQEMSAGYHTCQWNAINATSGIYFYRLEAGSSTQTKKLVVLR